MLFYNTTFFSNVILVYPLILKNSGFLVSLVAVFFTFNFLLFTLLSSKWTTKPILIIVLIISSLTTYFINTYHVIIDDEMIRNTIQTNVDESMDLVSLKQIMYLLFLGLIPSYFVYKAKVSYKTGKEELFSKFKVIIVSLVIISGSILLFSKHYTSFAREHKPLRFTTNPTYWIYSVGKYLGKTLNTGDNIVKQIGLDANISNSTSEKKLVIMVVGEAVRADHFSLNGYYRKTNPLLEKEDIINYTNVSSCGTATAVSVPCMFSQFTKSQFSYKKGIGYENVLDVLNHTNQVSVLWRDNNSNSKGVALRVTHENYRNNKRNTICIEGECRDEGMLIGLDNYIKNNKDKNIFIVLHQMGNHGPAYYKRYPKAYEKFKPTCLTNQVEECLKHEIVNAYDNSILYTDNFLTKTIQLLKKYNQTHQTAMLYMSDHGESLGEHGIYLHGLPYFIAPEAQTHIASLVWFGEKMKQHLDIDNIKKKSHISYSQDNLFHTILGLFHVKTKVYEKDMDMFR